MVKGRTEVGEYSHCEKAETCKMNKYEKYDINPIFLNSRANRYACHGLRDTITEGGHIFFSTCWDIEQLNKELEREEEIEKLRKIYGTKI